MNKLIPFETSDLTQYLRLNAGCEIEQGALVVHFVLEGDLGDILVAETSHVREFKDELWKKTCFEVFVSTENSSAYTEWNLGADGFWACYLFKSYRVPESPGKSLVAPRFIQCHRAAQNLSLQVGLTLPPDLSGSNLNIGLTTVLEHSSGNLSYWALAHLGAKPDFHLRDSFVLRL